MRRLSRPIAPIGWQTSKDSGVILWCPSDQYSVDGTIAAPPKGLASKTQAHDLDWLLHVAVNPNIAIEASWNKIDNALAGT